ncbi:reverse transcriptase [Gossypium australe]|uniref:Reverse transcriptase n=1 Tax=Gossypium australe TaxID=47621 RepID=A0A5B6VMQ8_9ROSI|nr:reverse transcriptase [Gossypium australe]
MGNGKSIDIWRDNWGFEENNVSKPIDANREVWKENRIHELYRESLKDQICKIPFPHDNHANQRIWFHNPCGFFSTETTYLWLILNPHRNFWRMIWKLKTLPKFEYFCWKLGHEILPTYDKITSIRSGFNSLCPRCGIERETLIHALRDCLKARAVLEHGGLNNRLLDEKFTRCIDWIEEAMRMLDKTAMTDLITDLWNSGNNCVFRGDDENARVTWERASCLSHGFRIFNLVEKPMLPKTSENSGGRNLRSA